MSVHDAASRVEPGAGTEADPGADPGPAQVAPAPDGGPGRGAGGGPGGGRVPARDGRGVRQLPQRAGQLLGRVPRGWRLPLATFLVCQAIFLFWWAAFYPGLMSFDSVAYVLQVTIGPLVNNYSVLYDALVWLSLHLTGGVAVLTLAQTVAMSAAFAYTVAAFRRIGVPGRWTAAAAVIAAAIPSTGTFVIFVWKDVGFAICTFLVVPTLAHLVSLRAAPGWRRDRRANWLIAALGLEMIGIMLFRLNGFLVIAVAAVVLLIVLPGIRVRLIAATVVAGCVVGLMTFVLYPAAGVQKTPAWEAYSIQYADIAVAYSQDPATFTPADLLLMRQAASLATWRNTANCYDSDLTDADLRPAAHSEPLDGQLLALWTRVLTRTPDLVLGARICRGSIAWSIFAGPVRRHAGTITDATKIDPGLWGLVAREAPQRIPYRDALRTRPLSVSLNKTGLFLRSLSSTPQLGWLLWRGAFWCYLSYLAVWLFARRRRDWALLSLGAVVAGQQITVLADIPNQLFRYMASPIFIGIIFIPLLFAHPRPDPVTTAAAAREPAQPVV